MVAAALFEFDSFSPRRLLIFLFLSVLVLIVVAICYVLQGFDLQSLRHFFKNVMGPVLRLI